MEPSYRLLKPPGNRSLLFKHEPFGLLTRWHYHPEIELIYVIEGVTNGVVGNGFREFLPGDLVILGANLPHVLQENQAFSQRHPGIKPFGLIVQFLEDFLGAEFFKKVEFEHISAFLERCKRGVQFGDTYLLSIRPQLDALPNLSETARILALLTILDQLARTDNYTYLTPEGYRFDEGNDDEGRIRKVNEFVYKHFAEKISIADAAAVAHMSETAFCRYFKARTLKTFTHYLNEIRVAYACKLLVQNQKSIMDIGFESGFNNLSYFNRQFKQLMGVAPGQFARMRRGS